MAHKKLDHAQRQELERMVMGGTPPADISDYFGIAVSSVHNYKRLLAEKGLQVPDLRGKRPSGVYKRKGPVKMLTKTGRTGFVHVVVNGVTLYISNLATTVEVSGHKVVVEL
jgi:transposase